MSYFYVILSIDEESGKHSRQPRRCISSLRQNIDTLYHSHTGSLAKAGIIVLALPDECYLIMSTKDTVIPTVTSSIASHISAAVIMIFQIRSQTGEKLAQALKTLGVDDSVVLALSRDGVPVGAAIAKSLTCAFDCHSTDQDSHPLEPRCELWRGRDGRIFRAK